MSRNHLDLAGLIPSSHTRSVNAIQQATCLTVGVFTIGRLPSADASVESSCASPPTDISQSKTCSVCKRMPSELESCAWNWGGPDRFNPDYVGF